MMRYLNVGPLLAHQPHVVPMSHRHHHHSTDPQETSFRRAAALDLACFAATEAQASAMAELALAMTCPYP